MRPTTIQTNAWGANVIPIAAEKPYVLLITRFLTERLVIRESLHRLGFSKIIEAGDGAGGWEIIKNNDIGLVICDDDLPIISGRDLAVKVRTMDEKKSVPFILTKEKYSYKELEDSPSDALTFVITKPYSEDLFMDNVEQAVRAGESRPNLVRSAG